MNAEANVHPGVNKYQDVVASADPEGPKDMDADSSFLPEVPEDHEVIGTDARDK